MAQISNILRCNLCWLVLVLAHTSILQEHNEKLSKQIFDQKQALLDLNKQCASKTHEVKLKKAAMKNFADAEKSYLNKESERLDEMVCIFVYTLTYIV
jgi:hypothetical protein